MNATTRPEGVAITAVSRCRERLHVRAEPARRLPGGSLGAAIALHVGLLLATTRLVRLAPPPKIADALRVEVVQLPTPAPSLPPLQQATTPVAAIAPAPPASAATVSVPDEVVADAAPPDPVVAAPPAAPPPPVAAAAVPVPVPAVASHLPAHKPPPLRKPASQALPAAAPAPPTATPVAAAAAPAPAPPAPPAADVADAEARLEARIRDAVQEAVQYPPSARMMGMTGRARVLLDYQSGHVDNPSVVQSSGAPVLDGAALAAARTAHYPAPTPDLAARRLRLLVWVEFRL